MYSGIRTVLAFCLALGCIAAEARREGCDDASLPPDQRWNGATSYTTPPLARFYDLSNALSASYSSGAKPSVTRQLAQEYLAAAANFPCNWNYGNAIHNANAVLGLLALREGKRAQAAQFLQAAGATPGSPQLNSFGPSLLLAQVLSEVGEFEAVALYLVAIHRFWRAKDMSPTGLLVPALADPDPLATWAAQAREKQVPNFGPFNMRAP